MTKKRIFLVHMLRKVSDDHININNSLIRMREIFLCFIGNQFLTTILTIKKYSMKKEHTSDYSNVDDSKSKCSFEILIPKIHRKYYNHTSCE